MITSMSGTSAQFLSGGGEMGALMRSKNWREHAIGTVEGWPQSLRTTLSILLNSKFPMFLWWGPELTCFYNDAYRPSLGSNGKHPGILGEPAEKAWPEIWHIIKPLIDQVLTIGEATWHEDQLIPIFRNGKIEDVYWTFSYSPVNDESGKISGVLVICNETTEKVRILREIKEREDQLSFTINAAELGTWDLDPATSSFMGNDRLKDWFGLPGDKEIALPLALIRIVKRDRQIVRRAMEQALQPGSDGNYEIEFTISNPLKNIERRVVAKGKALFNESNIAVRFSGTLQDITQQHTAIRKMEDSEKRFRDTVMQAPLGITIFRGPQFIVEMANETYLEIVDKKEKDFIGRPLFDSLPEVKDTVEALLTNVLTNGIPFKATEFSVTLNRYGKQELSYFNMVYQPLKEENGTITGIIVVATEVTESVKARHSLSESEKQFRKMVMQSPIPMTIFRGEDYIIEMANSVMFETIWRKKEDEILGKKMLEVFPELMDQKYPQLLKEVYTTGKSHRETEAIAFVKGDDGLRKFYLDFDYSPLYETDGTISGIIVTVNDVTEKVAARETIAESEKRFRKVADGAPVLIWMSGTDMLCNFFNKAWLNFTGRNIEMEYGKGWRDVVHPEDLQKCIGAYDTSFVKKEEVYLEYRLKRYDGEYRWISEHGVPRFSADGIFEGYIGACMDIHERIIYQKKLKEDEERLNIVITASELGTWELNMKTWEVKYSYKYLEILGYKEKTNLTHEQILKHLHPDDHQIREVAFKEALLTAVLHYECRIIWNDQSIHWIESKGKVFYDEKNEPSLMIGTVADITEDKYYQQRLLEREQKFRLLADSMPQHIWTADTQGNLNYFNKSVFDYSGLTPEQINTGGWLQIVHPDDREENIRTWTEAINTGQDFLFEHRFRRNDGTYRWQLSRAMPQKDHSGNIQMWVGTSTDIQDQKMFTSELEKQVLERTKELEQKNKELVSINAELKSFAYVSSHDLQEPLRKIQTFASRILEKENQNLSDNGKDYFHRMQEAAKRMQTLIEDLLAYSRTNTAEQVFITVNIQEIVNEVKNEFREVLAEKNAVVEVSAMCEANIIPFQFRQLVHNLIGNSLKFSKAEIPPHIKIKSEILSDADSKAASLPPGKMFCHISFSDNGIGFDPKYKERIFEVFQRLHGKNEYKGTGIGLAIVKKIVENHNGTIVATGELNKGVTMDIYIPALPAAQS
ncbi:MAG: PAS domain S-box protein [Chitinophagales bacterium]